MNEIIKLDSKTINNETVSEYNNGWISTSVQLPKPNQLVIIAVDLGLDAPKICLGSYAKDDTPITDDEGNTYPHIHWWNNDNGDFMWEFEEVKYWQPLPELPKKGVIK